jgi:predicted ribosome quality control (RQC) complex YloA/Tae2 family protein
LPFDGIFLKSLVHELNQKLIHGRIEKIFQPEKDEVVLYLRNENTTHKLLLCCNPNMPRVHLTQSKKENPSTPPNFCMVLRKHLLGSKLVRLDSFGFERILAIDFETYSELQDRQVKRIIIEIMGKHSNIILINDNNKIIDAVKHIDPFISRVREVMPARPYSLPPVQDKLEPDTMDVHSLCERTHIEKRIDAFLLDSIMGFSPFLARHLCTMAHIPPDSILSQVDPQSLHRLKSTLQSFQNQIHQKSFSPCLTFESADKDTPQDFYCLALPVFEHVRFLNSLSDAAEEFYQKKDALERLNSKKSNLLKSVLTIRARLLKKISIYQRNLEEVFDRDRYKLYADLILAFIHSIPPDADKVILSNFYSENLEDIEIPLVPFLTPQKNASTYYKKYTKAKNTFENANHLLKTAHLDLSYIENILFSLESAISGTEIEEIRQECLKEGFLKPLPKGRQPKHMKNPKTTHKTPPPLKFKTQDGYILYVGKNNTQNDRLTLKEASANDIWLHTKDIPGSHVVIKKQQGDIPSQVLLLGAMFAAHFSRAKFSSNVAVDYTQIRHVKKPSGAKPGMVIYTHQKTLFVTPPENLLVFYRIQDEEGQNYDFEKC